jgi:hypothetical protein
MRSALRHCEDGPTACAATTVQNLLTLAAGGYAGLNEGCKAYLTATAPHALTTPLHLACCSGQLSLAAMLVYQSAWAGEGGAVDGEGRTPLEAMLHSRFVTVEKECREAAEAAEAAAAAGAAAGVVEGGGEGSGDLAAAEPSQQQQMLHPSQHPLLLHLTPALLENLVALLLAIQSKEVRGHVLAVGKACVGFARQGLFEAALQPLEAERRSRGGK